jgi:hypothetical protein
MADKKKWDLTSTHSLEGAAKWIRAGSGAMVVLVIRRDDWAWSADTALLPQDVVGAVREVLPALQDAMLRGRTKG